MAFVSDNVIDAEILKMKTFLENLKKTQGIFASTFHIMQPKERARTLTQIQSGHKTLQTFLEKSKKVEINNSGTRFALENIKQSLQTLLALWRKTEKGLESFVGGSASKQTTPSETVTGGAVEKYVSALKNLGHNPSSEMIAEFKDRLDAAYQKAREQSGGKDLAIHIVQEGSKIKVRMEPK